MSGLLMNAGTAVLILIFSLSVNARDRENGPYITGLLGYTLFDSERELEDDLNYAIGLGYDFNKALGAEVLYGIADLDLENADQEVDSQFYRLDLLYHLSRNALWRPFLIGGIGNYNYELSDLNVEDDETVYNLGGGLKRELNDALDLRFDARALYSEDIEAKDILLSVGLSYMFGGSAAAPKDSDGDGVYDDADACPDSAYGAKVDSRGCEVVKDSDGDGVADKADDCPNTPAGEAVNAQGCPIVGDKDGDGVNDDMDKCPTTPKGAAVDGKGCSLDGDRDGVADGLDACPTTPQGAKVDNRGCREQLADTVTINLNVKFLTNSADLPESYMAEVKRVADFMRQYPDANVVIEGHTDDRGDAKYNQSLSERRAAEVRNIVVDRFGVDAGRVTSVGYGETRPIADNNTKEGRQSNRRVVGVVSATVQK